MAECIYCGCTEDRACMIPIDQVSDDARESYFDYLELECAWDGEIEPETIPCSWISKRPPVCSAPSCRAALANAHQLRSGA